MPKTSSRLFGSSGSAVTPNSYHVEYFRITTNAGLEIDIKDLLQKFEISESVNAPTLQALFILADATNFFEDHKLNGNEKINMMVVRSPLKESDQNKITFKLELYIAEIFGYVRNTAGKQFYQFRCVSRHMYHNQLKVIRRSFQGSIGQLVSNICKNDLKIDMHLVNKSTKNIVKGIYPSIRPLQTVNWLMRNAFDHGAQYYFYETAKDGVIFDSYNSIVSKDTHSVYDNSSFYRYQQGSPEGYEEERKKIKRLSSPLGLSKLASTANGCYAATTHVVDISNKTYKKTVYDYDHGHFNTLNKYKPYNSDIKFLDISLNNHKESKNYFLSLNSKSYSNFDNYHSPLETTLAKGEAYINNLEFMTHNITINGDFELSVGMNVELKIVKASDVTHLDDPNVMIDKVLSGKYFVTDITHVFEESYTQRLIVKKDSIGVDLDA